ncbi:MAG TPA: twin-arginine translocase TatA/TatE family subunit [Firmicutes bacterium]|jgi:sec-independent protein translocase protein TatA|nr:twin-arginine translocase TatA/TatE family subunit [Bacillota bacterium]
MGERQLSNGRVVSVIGRIGAQELLLILVLALIIFGPRKLPELGRSLGQGIREFRKAATEVRKSINLESNTDSGEGDKPETQKD